PPRPFVTSHSASTKVAAPSSTSRFKASGLVTLSSSRLISSFPLGASFLLEAGLMRRWRGALARYGNEQQCRLRRQPPSAVIAIDGWRTATTVHGILGRPDWPPEH